MIRLSRFRRVARWVALWLLLAAPAGLLHSGNDDLACVPGAVPDGGAALAAAAADAADHCLVCHWTRSLRSPSPLVARVQACLFETASNDIPAPRAHREPALDRLPARAPPRTL